MKGSRLITYKGSTKLKDNSSKNNCNYNNLLKNIPVKDVKHDIKNKT